MTTLTNDGVIALAGHLGVQTLPLVLSVGPQQESHRDWALAQERARAELISGRVIDGRGDVEPDTAEAMFVLAQPERELAMRVFSEDGQTRVCVARRGDGQAVAVRRGDSLEIRTLWSDGSAESLARPIIDALGGCLPAEVANFSAPSAELLERFDAATTSEDYAGAVYSYGLEETEATAYGLALASCKAYAEVVAYAYADGVTDRVPGAVVVYDTARGRIVAAPGTALDQQLWSTLTPGTDHRVAQAISGLVDRLPGGRWLS
ncbi:ESX secretion-associated protein EspG [Nocardia otitidiscaviarum]|uniref:ESX secretion-associated protein EspG n=1 Tax=Nocardia otitidiscaviarum TaxID=1823 RepID=UPI00189427D2|nr:ESX secretion-associated protein EspG [Nocardia otitidiscaviarum]MBF6179638.1 ESX secretion-associated protein EspG [Nocardia otitidiscaviarum]